MKHNYEKAMEKMAKNIKKIMFENDISISELSKKSKIRKQYLIKILNVNATGLKLSHFEKLLEALNVEPRDLLR